MLIHKDNVSKFSYSDISVLQGRKIKYVDQILKQHPSIAEYITLVFKHHLVCPCAQPFKNLKCQGKIRPCMVCFDITITRDILK